MSDDVVAVITADGRAPESATHLMQCGGCGRFIDRLCSVCPPREETASKRDPLDHERHRERTRRENRIMGARHGERV